MAYYRLYFFDGPDGCIGSVAGFEAHCDPHALATAEAGRRGSARQELWCGPRMVATWSALGAGYVQDPISAS